MSEGTICEMFTTVVRIKEVPLLSKEGTRVIHVLLDDYLMTSGTSKFILCESLQFKLFIFKIIQLLCSKL